LERIDRMDFQILLETLQSYEISVLRILPNLFVALDFETKHREFLRASMVSIPLSDDLIIQTALELKYGVKLYTECDLRNILRGLILHEEYANAIKFLLPCEREVKILDKSKKIVGVADLLCGDVVIEIKTGRKPKHIHAYQLAIYLDLTGKQQGFLVYPDAVLEIPLSEDILHRAYQRLFKINNIVTKTIDELHNFRDKYLSKFGLKVQDLESLLKNLKSYV